MKKSILYILFALFSLSAAVSLTACKDDGVEISGANKSKTPKNVKLLEYGPTSLTICWDFIRGATSYTVQLVDGEMNPVSEALCKTTDAIDYHEFTDLATDRIYYGRVRANFPYSSTSDWVYVTANEQPAMLMASVGILELDPKLTLNAATGSTLTYEWSYTEDAATDATRLYNIELFRDEACSELHVSWLADGKLASDKGIFTALAGYPVVRFTFSGLDPETTYYARVTNASFGNIMTPVVAGTTAKAGPKASQNNPAQAGDIVLAQDFAAFIHGGDVVRSAAGYNAVSGTDYRKAWEPATGENPHIERASHFVDVRGIAQHRDPPPGGRDGGRLCIRRAAERILALRFEPRGVFASGSRIGVDDQFAPLPVDYQPVAGLDLPHAPGNADQRRDALVPGDDRDMARHASVRRHQSGDPAEIHLCRIRRRQLVGHHDRPGSQSGKGVVDGFARQDAADTRTDVPHIVGTSAQVVVVERREHAAHLFAGFTERLLGGQVLFRKAPLDQPGEHRVAGHLQMGGENSLPFCQCGQLRLRTLQRRMEPPGLGHGVACRGRSSGGCAALQHERRPDGDPRRRDSSDREHHSRMPAMKSVTARTAAASSPPSAQTSTSVPCLSPNARSERMLTALASRAALRRVTLAGASPLINFTSSPAGRACMPFGAVIVTFPVVI